MIYLLKKSALRDSDDYSTRGRDPESGIQNDGALVLDLDSR